jgi:hypothetical protein
MAPMLGAAGVNGSVLIIATNEAAETHPLLSVTENVYVPEESPENIPVVPVEFNVSPLGEAVTVQAPVEGNPLNETDPVEIKHVG